MAPLPSTTDLSASFHRLTQLPRELLQDLPQRLPQLHPRDALPSLHDFISSPSSTSPHKRQYTTVAIPATYQGVAPGSGSPGPGTGTIVGIVLGSVAGFVLLVWLLWTLANFQGNHQSNVIAESVEVVRERPLDRSPRSRRSHRSRRERETVVMRERSRSPTVRGGTERVILEERRQSRAPSIVPETRRETVIVEERRTQRVDGDDIVEVIEEDSVSSVRSPPPPRRERRQRSSGGYRSVDPNLFGGGDYPQHRVQRDRSISTRS